MTATSSQRLNLRPTSRSMPMSSNPQRSCRAREAVPLASMRAITAWKPLAVATLEQRRQQVPTDPGALAVTPDVDRVLDRGVVGGAVLVGDRAPNPVTTPPSTATMARKAP